MTIQQTVDIPASRKVHFDVILPETMPSGKAKVILDFSPVAPQSNPSPGNALEKALKEAGEKRLYNQAHPEEIRALRGCLKDSPIWDGLDGLAYQRKIRNEWEDRLVEMGVSNTTD